MKSPISMVNTSLLSMILIVAHISIRILHAGPKAQDRGRIPETAVCSILWYTWSVEPLLIGAYGGRSRSFHSQKEF